MPKYDYKCKDCDLYSEVTHSMFDEPEITCDACGTVMAKTFISSNAIHFKGTGFYKTDSSTYGPFIKGD